MEEGWVKTVHYIIILQTTYFDIELFHRQSYAFLSVVE